LKKYNLCNVLAFSCIDNDQTASLIHDVEVILFSQ